MGSVVEMNHTPRFQVKTAGAFKQLPGCPEFAKKSLGEERLFHLCRNECYNPSPQRKLIERLEIVKIRPQAQPTDDLEPLIEDPWLMHYCEEGSMGCSFSFEDPGFAQGGRDSVYYVRAIQQPSDAVNGDNLRCERDSNGRCIRLDPCHGNESETEYQDDCLAPVQERAWSSPIFVDHGPG